MVNFLVSNSYFFALFAEDYYESRTAPLTEAKSKSTSFWVYNICIFVDLQIFMNMNWQFLYFSFYDAFRRVWLMRQLSKSLESLNSKSGVDLKLPIINFMDKESLLSWLEARRLVLEIGGRFQVRIQYYSSYFLIIFIMMTVFIFMAASGLGIDMSYLTIPKWALFGTMYAYLTVFVIMILLPNAYLNKEMMW